MNEPFNTLISAAILAPSGDNTQPWRFEVDERRSTITVFLDPTRDTSPMNAGQHMARIACGAAIENIVQTAEFNHWEARVELHASDEQLATVHVDSRGSEHAGNVESALRDRCTNRHMYNGRACSASTLAKIRESCQPPRGMTIDWITDRPEIEKYATAIGSADAVMFGDHSFLSAFLANVRLDLPRHAAADKGLPLKALELSPYEQFALPYLGLVSRWRLTDYALKRAFGRKARRLVLSSTGLCVIRAAGNAQRENSVNAGRAMQRAWLQLQRLDFAVQPMMSIPVLQNHARHVGLSAAKSDVVEVQAILRFGPARAASMRTGRAFNARSLPDLRTIVTS